MQKITDRELHSAVLKRFMDKYVKPGTRFRDEQGNRNLLWCSLKDIFYGNCVYISTDDTTKIGLQEDLSMYVYFDRTEELYKTTFAEFCKYLHDREDWEYVDAEVFDDSSNWLFAVTHNESIMLIGFDEDE